MGDVASGEELRHRIRIATADSVRELVARIAEAHEAGQFIAEGPELSEDYWQPGCRCTIGWRETAWAVFSDGCPFHFVTPGAPR